MRRKSLVPVVLAALATAGAARTEFPFVADPNRCDTSANPPACIPLPNGRRHLELSEQRIAPALPHLKEKP